MLTSSPRFSVDRLSKLSILHVIGDVDEANSSKLETAMQDAARECQGTLIVAFVECTYVAATCLNALMRQSTLLANRLSVVAPPKSQMRRHIDQMSFGVTVHDGFREAVLDIGWANDAQSATDDVTSKESAFDTVA